MNRTLALGQYNSFERFLTEPIKEKFNEQFAKDQENYDPDAIKMLFRTVAILHIIRTGSIPNVVHVFNTIIEECDNENSSLKTALSNFERAYTKMRSNNETVIIFNEKSNRIMIFYDRDETMMNKMLVEAFYSAILDTI
jgi:hypothetical protein